MESLPGRMLGRLREMRNVLEVYEDSLFTGKLFSSALPRIKEAHEDLHTSAANDANPVQRKKGS